MKIFFKKLDENAKIPSKNRVEDEGWDMYSLNEYILKPNTTTIIKTGIAGKTDSNHWLQIESRSGLASKGIFTVGGVIDTNFRGECCVILANITQQEFHVKQYDRIAQLVIRDRHPAEIVEVEQLDTTDRQESGFGSSGQ